MSYQRYTGPTFVNDTLSKYEKAIGMSNSQVNSLKQANSFGTKGMSKSDISAVSNRLFPSGDSSNSGQNNSSSVAAKASASSKKRMKGFPTGTLGSDS